MPQGKIPSNADLPYEFDDLASLRLQAGVVSGGLVTRLTTTTVRAAAGTAWVPTGSGPHRRVTWAQTDFTVAAPTNAGNERVDQVVVGLAGPVVLAGSQVATGDLDANRSPSAAALGTSQIRLADVLTTQSGGIVNATYLRDRRPWAAGAGHRVAVTGQGADATGFTGTAALVHASLSFGLEVSGDWPVEVKFGGAVAVATLGDWIAPVVYIDGGSVAPGANVYPGVGSLAAATGIHQGFLAHPLTAGRHVFDLRAAASQTNAKVYTTGNNVVFLSARELVGTPMVGT